MKKIVTPIALASMLIWAQRSDAQVLQLAIPCSAGCLIHQAANVLSDYGESQGIKIVAIPHKTSVIAVNNAIERKWPIIGDVVDLQQHANFSQLEKNIKIGTPTMVLVVNKTMNLNSLDDVVAYEKTNPGKLNWSQAGHVQEKMITAFAQQKTLNADKIQRINYAGLNFISDIINNDVQLGFVSAAVATRVKDHVKIINIENETELKRTVGGMTIFFNSDMNSIEKNTWKSLIERFLQDGPSLAKLQRLYIDTSLVK